MTKTARGRPHDHSYCVAIINRRGHGLVISEISRELGINERRVRDTLQRHGVDGAAGKRSPTTSGRVEEIKAMFAAGSTQQAIAQQIGVSRERIRQVLTQAGVDTRRAPHSRHQCDDLCAALLAETPPVDIAALGRRVGRVYSMVLRRAQVHAVEFRSLGNKHVCDHRCERIKAALASGSGMVTTFASVGMAPGTGVQRYRAYHPEFAWPISEWWLRRKATTP